MIFNVFRVLGMRCSVECRKLGMNIHRECRKLGMKIYCVSLDIMYGDQACVAFTSMCESRRKSLFATIYLLMSSITETTPAATQSENTIESELRFITHLKTYPTAVFAKQELMKFPGFKSVVSTAKNVSTKSGIRVICTNADTVLDMMLDEVDWLLPSLKTVTVEDLSSPFIRTKAKVVGCTEAVVQTTEKAVEDHVTQPTKKIVNDVEDFVHNSVYTAEGKNKILSPMDVVVEPINNKMTEVVTHFNPETKIPTKEETSSEVARSKRLMWNFLTGTKLSKVTE